MDNIDSWSRGTYIVNHCFSPCMHDDVLQLDDLLSSSCRVVVACYTNQPMLHTYNQYMCSARILTISILKRWAAPALCLLFMLYCHQRHSRNTIYSHDHISKQQLLYFSFRLFPLWSRWWWTTLNSLLLHWTSLFFSLMISLYDSFLTWSRI